LGKNLGFYHTREAETQRASKKKKQDIPSKLTKQKKNKGNRSPKGGVQSLQSPSSSRRDTNRKLEGKAKGGKKNKGWGKKTGNVSTKDSHEGESACERRGKKSP